jgi:GT2 family glycosyltransferase
MASCPKIGVVTVTFNSADVLPEFLRCLFSQTHIDLILYAVDNASRDATIDLLRACSDQRLRVIANPDNLGVAEGNNQGIRAAIVEGCELILLINNDTAFDKDLIEGLVAGLEEQKCDMVCPKMLYHDQPDRIWAAGGEFQPLLGYRAIHFGDGAIDRGQFDVVRHVTYSPTCCVLIRAEVFDHVGLMDSRYFVYGDDADFMYRAMKSGKVLIYLPQHRLLHKVGYLTGGEDSPFAIHYGTRNRLFFLLKHFGLARTIPWMVICQIIWSAKLLFGMRRVAWFRLKQKAFRASLRLL